MRVEANNHRQANSTYLKRASRRTAARLLTFLVLRRPGTVQTDTRAGTHGSWRNWCKGCHWRAPATPPNESGFVHLSCCSTCRCPAIIPKSRLACVPSTVGLGAMACLCKDCRNSQANALLRDSPANPQQITIVHGGVSPLTDVIRSGYACSQQYDHEAANALSDLSNA